MYGYVQAYEFTDTLIMVLKKNERQISFLHIYHHATTFFPCWCACPPKQSGILTECAAVERLSSSGYMQMALHLARHRSGEVIALRGAAQRCQQITLI